jgi:7-cyano-7-deazaguanine synthase in queuosine biosynthesis
MNLLAQIETQSVDYGGQKMLLPLSGGINSAACLCWLLEEISIDRWPDELHLYYSHFKEHSPGTLKFVFALVKYAKSKFPDVKFKFTRNSVKRCLMIEAIETLIRHAEHNPTPTTKGKLEEKQDETR